VVGFPLGASTSSSKVAEAHELIKLGVHELDLVMNIGKFKEGNYKYVMNDIKAVVDLAKKDNITVKVILETGLLDSNEVVDACIIACMAGADFVKTSTGFGYGGAVLDIVKLMRHTVGNTAQVKASGGIKTFADAEKFVKVGANRLGVSSGVAIVKQQYNIE